MYYKLFFAAFLIIATQSCKSDTELHKVMDEEGNLVEEYTRNIKDYSKEGIYKKYYPNGGPIMEMATYKKDTMDGEYVRFYETGDTLTIAKMVNGKYHGFFREYFPNNKILQDYQYVDGAIDGKFLTYYENGILKEEVNFKKNMEDGPFIEYHNNGQKATEGVYSKGAEVGELLEYDKTGKLIRKKNCELVDAQGQHKSICLTTWEAEEE